MAKLKDGYQTLITFAENGSIKLYEKAVTPGGIDGGDAINQTTMRNSTWRTKAPRSLKEMTDISATCAYDPAVYDEVMAMINVNQLITVTFPDDTTLDVWGFLKSFIPGELVEGEQPEAEIVIVPTLMNDSDAETAPDWSV